MFVILLGVALVAHQGSYVAGRGIRYLTRTFAPALGLRLPRPWFVAVQVGAVPVAVAALAVGHRASAALAAVVLLLFAAVQTFRLSNHICLVVLGTIAVALSGGPTVLDAHLLLGCVYLTAGLLKCNREFLFRRTGTARYIVAKYLYILSRDLTGTPRRTPDAVLAMLGPAVAVVEVGVGVALLAWVALPAGLAGGVVLPAALAAALLLHAAFGLTGNLPFSLMVLPFWYVALGGAAFSGGLAVLAGAAAVVGVAAGYVFGAHWTYRTVHSGRLSFAVLGGLFGGAAVVVLAAALRPGPPSHFRWDPGALFVLVAFTANLALLVTGRKSEWSFAMFSNVRPYGPARVLGLRPLWTQRYYAVRWAGPFPRSISDAVPLQVARSLRTADNLVSAPIARELRAHAGTDVELVPVRFDPDGRRFADEPDGAVEPRGGPLWVAPVMPRDPDARYLG